MKQARFLVLRGGALGDFILTLPAIQALRARWPQAWIELIGYPHIAGLALLAGLVDRVDSLDRAGMARFFSAQPSFTAGQSEYLRGFDLVVSYLHDPAGVVRNNLLLAGARQVLYGSPIVRQGHAVEHLMKPLESLAIYAEGDRPRLDLPDRTRHAGRLWLKRRGLSGPVLVLHPGSGSPKKNWPADRFIALARQAAARLGVSPLFLLGEADDEPARVVRAEARDLAVMADASLEEVASVLAAGRAFVGNDSGITHLAAAVGLPVVAVFGPSDENLWGPRGDHVRILRGEGGDLRTLGVEEVVSAVGEVLIDTGAPSV